MEFHSSLRALAEQLSQAGLSTNSWRELRILIAFIQNRSYSEVFFDLYLSKRELSELISLVQRRCKGEPLAKITGKKEFWSLPFKVNTDTLDPRPDSETIIQAILKDFTDHTSTLRIIDLGTGTGCLLLSTLSEYPQAWGIGVDISTSSLKIAQENALALNFNRRAFFICGDWAEPLREQFDIIISNPPYIRLDEKLDSDVKYYDPPQALYGGEDGFEAYKILLPQLKILMHKDSLAFIEIGQGQGDVVRQIGTDHGLVSYKNYQDLSGIERVLVFKKL
jgi:release factor glutamine methyltransferase